MGKRDLGFLSVYFTIHLCKGGVKHAALDRFREVFSASHSRNCASVRIAKSALRLSALVSTLNLVCDAPVRQHHRFPRGEAVERSETDEERRYGTISYAVRKKGTI